MGQVVQTNGDYTIKTADGGEIKFDVGTSLGGGVVRVTGNLIVEGDTLTVSTENLVIDDNIIYVNNGDGGPGVTLDWAGIQIKRGPNLSSTTYKDALFVLDDRDINNPIWNIAFGAPTGVLNYSESNLKLRRIYTDSGTDSGDLTLLDNLSPNGVLKVRSDDTDDGTEYRDNIEFENDIPNKRYVDDAIQNNPTFQIVRDNTRVVSFDKENTLDVSTFPIGPYSTQPTDDGFPTSLIGVVVDNVINSTFFVNRAIIQGLEISGTTVSNDDSGSNILFRTNGSGSVEFNSSLQLDYLGVDPNVDPLIPTTTESVRIYSNTPGVGQTGLYFKNPSYSDELISKNKALLLSMIF